MNECLTSSANSTSIVTVPFTFEAIYELVLIIDTLENRIQLSKQLIMMLKKLIRSRNEPTSSSLQRTDRTYRISFMISSSLLLLSSLLVLIPIQRSDAFVFVPHQESTRRPPALLQERGGQESSPQLLTLLKAKRGNNNDNNKKNKKRGRPSDIAAATPPTNQAAATPSQSPPQQPDPNDPRAYRRNRQILYELNEKNNMKNAKKAEYKRVKQALEKRKRDEASAAAAFDLPEQPVVRTLGGGTAMMFAMAARMFEQNQLQQQQQQQSQSSTTNDDAAGRAASSLPNDKDSSTLGIPKLSGIGSLPRWRPAAGIANVNPAFRTSSPTMNNQGYAGVIWRNVRKRNKPSLWRYALRTYDRMTVQQQQQQQQQQPTINNKSNNVLNDGGNDQGGVVNAELVVQPTNIHHEGALLAAAKLGLWQRALEIYRLVQTEEKTSLRKIKQRRPDDQSSVHVTEHMVGSVVRACVKGSKCKYGESSRISSCGDPTIVNNSALLSIDQRRKPLDEARSILHELKDVHGIPLDAKHVNPLAAAYQSLGLRLDAVAVVEMLGDRVIGPEPESGHETLNINNLAAKDKASYALQVTAAVRDEDWAAAVENLTTMTEAGLYPVNRHLNVWTEVSERKTQHRGTRSYKKKRESWVLQPTMAGKS